MEFVDGRSLRQILERLSSHGSHIPVAAVLHIAQSIGAALAHAHEALDDLGRELKVIHGDVSPHNVLLGIDGQVKLMDFGLARASANLAERPPDRISGKYGYLAPEVVLRREASQSMDLFALGIVLWESLTGKRLFQVRNLNECRRAMRNFEIPRASLLNPAVSAQVDALLTLLLKRSPEERVSARQFVEAVDKLLAGLPENLCRQATAKLVQLNLGERHKRHSGRVITHLDDEQLEEFFLNAATTVGPRPRPIIW
jgi:serine/threonine-protein kinase